MNFVSATHLIKIVVVFVGAYLIARYRMTQGKIMLAALHAKMQIIALFAQE